MAPVFLFPPDDYTYTVNEFNPVTFQCIAFGLPSPTLSWFKDGEALNTAYDSRITVGVHSAPVLVEIDGETVYEVNQNLTLDNTMDDDSGTYTCQATNENAVQPIVRQDFELFVRSKPICIMYFDHNP